MRRAARENHGDTRALVGTFPDWKMEILDLVAEGDVVVARCRVSGTHKGVGKRPVNGALLMGAEPTGRRFEVQHIHWYRVRDGKITDHFTNRDDLGMTQQLGLLPAKPPLRRLVSPASNYERTAARRRVQRPRRKS
jgi:predicted ester cyclase